MIAEPSKNTRTHPAFEQDFAGAALIFSWSGDEGWLDGCFGKDRASIAYALNGCGFPSSRASSFPPMMPAMSPRNVVTTAPPERPGAESIWRPNVLRPIDVMLEVPSQRPWDVCGKPKTRTDTERSMM